jgi:hypothetical protein
MEAPPRDSVSESRGHLAIGARSDAPSPSIVPAPWRRVGPAWKTAFVAPSGRRRIASSPTTGGRWLLIAVSERAQVVTNSRAKTEIRDSRKAAE